MPIDCHDLLMAKDRLGIKGFGVSLGAFGIASVKIKWKDAHGLPDVIEAEVHGGRLEFAERHRDNLPPEIIGFMHAVLDHYRMEEA